MYCQNCGAELSPKSNFCPSCGVKVEAGSIGAKVQPAAPAPMPPPGDEAPLPMSSLTSAGQPYFRSRFGAQASGGPGENPPGSIGWSMAIPIFRGEVFRQLGLVIGIPFGLLAIFLMVSAGGEPYGFYGVGLIAALLFLTWLFMKVVYGGKYDAEFLLDDKGALYRTEARQARKNRIVNILTVLAGLLSGKLTAAGAGLLAGSRQNVFISWERLTKVTYKPRSRTILLRAGLTENIGLFCTGENYAPVERFVRKKTEHLLGVDIFTL